MSYIDLMDACKNGNIVQQLMNKLNYTNYQYQEIFKYACDYGQLEIEKRLYALSIFRHKSERII